jgi:hypothetical protein
MDEDYYKKEYRRYRKKYNQLKRLLGGNPFSYDYTTPEGVQEYIKFVQSKVTSYENPYLLILYGPPATGKTTAKNVALTELGLASDYVYISEDQFVYDTKQFQELTQRVNIEDLKNLPIEEIINNPEVQLLQQEYNRIRKSTKFLIHVFMGLALMYKYNVVLEMTGNALDWYVTHVVDEFAHYKYENYVVYPKNDNADELYKRSIERGFKEYRFIPSDYFYQTFERSRKNFSKLDDNQSYKKMFKDIYYLIDGRLQKAFE